MENEFKTDRTYIMDLAMLNTYNGKGCESCNRRFNLGDTVVMAVGGWGDSFAKLIHKEDAVFDKRTNTYYERTYFHSMRGKE
ncbi:MAG: hypothetical protein MI862_00265 [Desulfobacterales bacterium]|nr:hypothetical protein [Desulfobacterales bacterium]